MSIIYLKLGADTMCSAKQAKFVEAYANRKKTEARGEIASKEPISNTN